MEHVRHRTASGDLERMWEFDPARCALIVVMRHGSAPPIDFTIEVCAVDRPRHGAYPIQRLDGESWRVLPVRWAVYPTGHYVDSAIHESLSPGQQLLLTNSPEDVTLELESL